MENIGESTWESTANGGRSGRQDQRGIKELRNRKRGLEIKRCNLSTGRAKPTRMDEEDETWKAIAELQTVICEAELAAGC